jgi:hypothetical protein
MMKAGQLKVWWIPQVPMRNPFEVEVETLKEAKLLLDALVQYDIYQYKNRIKPDYSNAGGLSIWDEDCDGEGNAGWIDWMDEDGDDIDAHFEKLESISEKVK